MLKRTTVTLVTGLCVATAAVAETDVSDSYTCASDSAHPVLEIDVARDGTPMRVFHIGVPGNEGGIVVSTFYAGYRVLGVKGHHGSPMMTFRMEVFRSDTADEYRGLMWDFGATSPFNVICTNS